MASMNNDKIDNGNDSDISSNYDSSVGFHRVTGPGSNAHLKLGYDARAKAACTVNKRLWVNSLTKQHENDDEYMSLDGSMF